MDADATEPESNNLTRAGVTGKVPRLRTRTRRGGRVRKLKMSSGKRTHTRHLMARGVISQSAAASNGIKGK